MGELKVGSRVIVHDGLFGNGVIENEVCGLYTVKCDNKLPNEYAWKTSTGLFFSKDLKLEKEQ